VILHFTQYAPAWGAPGQTAYLILIGLNIELGRKRGGGRASVC
jgi:hypothetical protein